MTIDIRTANKMTLEIVGYFIAKIDSVCNNGDVISYNANIFVSDNVDDFFLSYDTSSRSVPVYFYFLKVKRLIERPSIFPKYIDFIDPTCNEKIKG